MPSLIFRVYRIIWYELNNLGKKSKDTYDIIVKKNKTKSKIFEVSLLMINITNNETKFNDLEEKIWKKKMQGYYSRFINFL